jgi:hypothetical protein
MKKTYIEEFITFKTRKLKLKRKPIEIKFNAISVGIEVNNAVRIIVFRTKAPLIRSILRIPLLYE